MTWYKNFVRNGKYRGNIFEQALYLATKGKSWRPLVANCDELWKHTCLVKLRGVEDKMERRQLNACFSLEWRFDLPSKRYTYDKYEAK